MKVCVHDKALGYLLEIRDKRLQNLIRRKIDKLAEEPRPKDAVEEIHRDKSFWHIEFANHRIVYQIKDEVVCVMVLSLSAKTNPEKLKKIVRRYFR